MLIFFFILHYLNKSLICSNVSPIKVSWIILLSNINGIVTFLFIGASVGFAVLRNTNHVCENLFFVIPICFLIMLKFKFQGYFYEKTMQHFRMPV